MDLALLFKVKVKIEMETKVLHRGMSMVLSGYKCNFVVKLFADDTAFRVLTSPGRQSIVLDKSWNLKVWEKS